MAERKKELLITMLACTVFAFVILGIIVIR
jgi:hypothetical protein